MKVIISPESPFIFGLDYLQNGHSLGQKCYNSSKSMGFICTDPVFEKFSFVPEEWKITRVMAAWKSNSKGNISLILVSEDGMEQQSTIHITLDSDNLGDTCYRRLIIPNIRNIRKFIPFRSKRCSFMVNTHGEETIVNGFRLLVLMEPSAGPKLKPWQYDLIY